MRGELVAFDLETTGLDVETDSIIEIGAVRIVDGVVTDEYSTLVNPGFAIPQETTYITELNKKTCEMRRRWQLFCRILHILLGMHLSSRIMPILM